MAKYQLTLDDSTVDILLAVGRELGLPRELTTEESIECAIDALAQSYDAAVPIESAEMPSGEPISAADLQKALSKALDADISVPVVRDKKQGDLDI